MKAIDCPFSHVTLFLQLLFLTLLELTCNGDIIDPIQLKVFLVAIRPSDGAQAQTIKCASHATLSCRACCSRPRLHRLESLERPSNYQNFEPRLGKFQFIDHLLAGVEASTHLKGALLLAPHDVLDALQEACLRA